MALQRLKIVNIRNISRQEMDFSNNINVLYGGNGSGKTAILEAIYTVSLGKSFRAPSLSGIVQLGSEGFMVSADLQATSVKLQKKNTQKAQFFVANNPVDSIVELARLLPVQLLNLQGYQLLNAPPETRRKFLDWTMFHVEPAFFKLWRDYHQVLRQRNAVLRDKYTQNNEGLGYWTAKLAELGQQLHVSRETVLKNWLEYTENFCEGMPGVNKLKIAYESGWDADERDFAQKLQQSALHDKALGYTKYGPHRADLSFTLADGKAQHLLSTGQQKSFVAALQLAQSQWVAEATEKNPILLIDDLPSELDAFARAKLADTLSKTSSQVFITSVEKKAFLSLLEDRPKKMFHVEQGAVTAVIA
jgi:DNA replication and repair protein RecF